MEEIVLGEGKTSDLLREGQIRQVRLQTKGGQTLVAGRVGIDVASNMPAFLRTPARALACATGLAAKFVGLQIVVERDE